MVQFMTCFRSSLVVVCYCAHKLKILLFVFRARADFIFEVVVWQRDP